MTLPHSFRSRRTLGFGALVLLLLGVAFALWRFEIYSVQPVGAGFFRSSQPSAKQLQNAIRKYDIRTVVNLRGKNPKKEWYREEKQVAEQEHVTLVDLPFETFDWPPRIETLRLVEATTSAPRPLLLHCATGIDRTGWASAVIRLLRGESLEAAMSEMSRARGHFCRRAECPLHRFFAMYESWLAANKLPHSAANFRRWIDEAYVPPPYDARIVLLQQPPASVPPGAELTLRVRVTNASASTWTAPVEGDQGIRLGARMLGPFPSVPEDGLDRLRAPRAPAHDVFRDDAFIGSWPPGLAREIGVSFSAPSRPGTYLLQIDMVDEHVHWFSDLGRPGVVVPVIVTQ